MEISFLFLSLLLCNNFSSLRREIGVLERYGKKEEKMSNMRWRRKSEKEISLARRAWEIWISFAVVSLYGWPNSGALLNGLFVLVFEEKRQQSRGKNVGRNFNPPARHSQKCIHLNDGNETTRMKLFLAISFYLYPTGRREVVGRVISVYAMVWELSELPDMWAHHVHVKSFSELLWSSEWILSREHFDRATRSRTRQA